jgi:4-hydroxybenzoate polyprenyltransferase
MAAASVGLDPFNTYSVSIAGSTAALTLSHYIWTTIFDYVNACQDTPDDEKAGVRSMAVRYQDTGAFITTLGTVQVACLVATGVLAGFSPVYFIGTVGGNIIGLVSFVRHLARWRSSVSVCVERWMEVLFLT